MNAHVLQGRWNEIKGQLKQRWHQLTEHDLASFEGNVDQLIGRIQEKTGESREVIEHYLNQLMEQGQQRAAAASQRFQEASHAANERFRRGYEDVRESAFDRYAQAEDLVRTNPWPSVGTAFGVGVLVGVTIGLLWRQR